MAAGLGSATVSDTACQLEQIGAEERFEDASGVLARLKIQTASLNDAFRARLA
jgi:hypothetical protein